MSKFLRCAQTLSLVAVILNCEPTPGAAPQWTDDTFEDFAAGKLDEAGQNLYVSRDGKIRTINRFDLNGDGHLDLLFNCTHDTYQMLPATVGTLTSDRSFTSTDLAVEGSLNAVVGDLNRDGFSDLVVCPNNIGVHHDRRFVSIAWGGSDGWSASRITSGLPIHGAVRAQIVDLNHDGWPDIAVLGAPRWLPDQPAGRIIRVFWGSAQGLVAGRRSDFGVDGALDIAAADFDLDGAADLAVLCAGGCLHMKWGTVMRDGASEPEESRIDLPPVDITSLTAADVDGDGRSDVVFGLSSPQVLVLRSAADRQWADPESFAAAAATHVAAGDVDSDGHVDLVLTQFEAAHAAGGEQAGAAEQARDTIAILWGERGKFDSRRMSRITMKSAVATAIGDLDQDGHPDIAVAVHQGEGTFEGVSRVWFGDGRRGFVLADEGFRSSGTTGIVLAPPEHGLPARVVLCNSIGGRYDEAVPLHVYWGGEDGFDPDRLWKIPFQSGYEASAADLNADGHLDLIALNSGHAHSGERHETELGANIFWGGTQGLDLSNRTVLHEHYLGSSSVADLNRDGWLDLVLEPFGPEQPGETDKLFIYYGSADGYAESRRAVLDKPGYSQEHVVADFNRDDWLDIAHTSRSDERVRILWGGPDGFDVERSDSIELTGALGLSAADLNSDGWLDLYVSTYGDPIEGYRDLGSVIYWGGPDGYRPWNAQWLPGFSPLGRTIADFDGDGHLDLFSPQHSGELTREDLACHIYWGSAEGFHTRRRTTLFCDSVNDSLAGDFNRDGLLDLAVACHTRHGNHRTVSRVFYNDGARFQNPKITKLPTNGTHLMWALDLGHIAHRRYEQAFQSRVFAWDGAYRGGTLTSSAAIGEGTSIEWMLRTAPAQAALKDAAWQPVDAEGRFALQPDDRVLQYQAVFRSDNGDRYPILDRVDVSLLGQ